ncbi:uncharacterized protein LOC111305628 isoform X2 [Durio zibethinus]|uniref:Uncharacterized protein LOC111305628 isoform X2 n=1 Tax=Durio zibethinus TaxID=66656 RepID=A0A6P6A2X7_DURZI|nr:uncharacterized protein LOC111305628 isoform X2 [Durio zibethinus]
MQRLEKHSSNVYAKKKSDAELFAKEIPDTPGELIEYFLDTEAQEIEFKIARLRQRLDEEFFSHLKFEIGQIRFAVSKTEDMEDRLIELEALQKALQEGTEAYDKMQADLIAAKKSLTNILTSKDIKATKQAVAFMEKVRAAVLKYLMRCSRCKYHVPRLKLQACAALRSGHALIRHLRSAYLP